MNNTLIFSYYDSGVQFDAVLDNVKLQDPLKTYIKNCYELFTTETFVHLFTEAYNICTLYVIDNGYIQVFNKGEPQTMTSHINETCTLMSKAKSVQDFQNRIHTEQSDTDFLRKFNENFDEKITGKVLSCDIELYDISPNPNVNPTLEIELTVYNADTFCIVRYTTDTVHYYNPSVVTYARENS